MKLQTSVFAALILVGGCGTPSKEPPHAAVAGSAPVAASLVWPSPPDKPRIAWLQSIVQPADLGTKTSSFGRFAHWVTGSEKGNEPIGKPFGIAMDENDGLCVTDTASNAVCYFDRVKKKWRRWDKLGKFQFISPVSVAKQKGNFYVADSGLGAVVVFNENSKLLFQITDKLERPTGLAITTGKLFIADSQRHSVICFDLAGHYLFEFGHRGAGPGEFNFPTHVAADADGNLFITDSLNNRIQVFSPDGRFKNQIGAIGDSLGQFSRPKGVAVDSFGHVYVVDALFDNVQVFDRDGRFLLNFGSAGTEPGEFWMPAGIAINRDNEIFIADSYNHRVQVFDYVGDQ